MIYAVLRKLSPEYLYIAINDDLIPISYKDIGINATDYTEEANQKIEKAVEFALGDCLGIN